MTRRTMINQETRQAVVRDYEAGNKVIVILYVYKLSPTILYRILHDAKVTLRRWMTPQAGGKRRTS